MTAALIADGFVVAVLIVGGLGALLLPRIVDSQIIREKVSAELAKRFGARLITGKIELL
jgi:hypothetical protein